MTGTYKKVIHNRDGDDEKNEMDKHLEEDKMKSTQAPTGKSYKRFRLEDPSIPTKIYSKDDMWKLLASEPEKPANPGDVNCPEIGNTYGTRGPLEVTTGHTHRQGIHRSPFLPGGPAELDPTDPKVLKYAATAVNSYNNNGYKDKLELVKVKKATKRAVAGFRYDLTFDAKVLGVGAEDRTETYYAWVHVKGGRPHKVYFLFDPLKLPVKLACDAS